MRVVDADAPLIEVGVNSLGAVEQRNQLQRAVGDDVALSSAERFGRPTAGHDTELPGAGLRWRGQRRAAAQALGGMGGSADSAHYVSVERQRL